MKRIRSSWWGTFEKSNAGFREERSMHSYTLLVRFDRRVCTKFEVVSKGRVRVRKPLSIVLPSFERGGRCLYLSSLVPSLAIGLHPIPRPGFITADMLLKRQSS